MRIAILLLFSMLALNLKAQQIQFTNPILSGFYPDPSITKVNDNYYLINSTFSYFPGIPIFHSKDLKNWKQIGNAINRPSQMDFMGEQVSRGLFAPSINFHNGTYYIVCTDIDHDGNFVITATDPKGPWSNPKLLPEISGIDPSLFFEDNSAYLVYNSDAPDQKPLYDGHRTIRLYEFDVEKLEVIGKEVLLVNGGVDISKKPVWIEGPHIYKRNGYYYLIAAEGGTSVNHSQVALRSTDVKGPYVPYENNPILTQRHLDAKRKDPITSTGHADLVEGPDGNTYAVFLAVRPYEDNYYNTGRETFIAPVKWIDGWPVINPDHEEVQYQYSANYKEIKDPTALPQSGNFSYRLNFKDSLDNSLLFLRTLDTSWYNISKDKGLTLNLLPEMCSTDKQPAFIGKRQQHLHASASTELTFKAQGEKEKAGLLIFQNEYHYYFLARSVKNGKDVIQLYKGNPISKKEDLITEVEFQSKNEKVFLRIEANESKYNFYYGLKEGDWILLKANVDGKFLSTSVAGGFVGSLFALYATSNGTESDNIASFKYLDYKGLDAVYE